MELVPEPQRVNKGSVSPGSTKRPCGSRIKSVPRFQRLEAEHNNFRPNVSKVGPSKHRSFCISPNFSTGSVCERETRPPGYTYRRFHSELDDIPGIRIPPIRTDRSVPSTGSESGGGTPGVSGTSLASPNMIPSLTRTFCRLSPSTANASEPVDPTGRNHPLHQLQLAGWLLSTVRGYQTEGISEQTRKILLAAWTPNTTSSYSSAWNIWRSWCAERVTVNPLSPSLNNILDFFTSFDEGKEYRTINVYRSALSAILPLYDGQEVGCHPLVCQLLKGVYHLRHPQPRSAKTWQVYKLVHLMESLGPNNQRSAKLLSYKIGWSPGINCPRQSIWFTCPGFAF